jgi:cytochrome c
MAHAGESEDARALIRSRNCLACHQSVGKLLGPGFDEINEKYRDSPGAADVLVKKIRKGGVGKWGQVPMPANLQVSEDEAKQLVKWLLAKPETAKPKPKA